MTLQSLYFFISEHQATIVLLATLSVVAFLISIIVLPLILIRLPADYFVTPPHIPERHPVIGIILKLLKNAIGLLLLAIGFIMLFIPGQGILTMLFGLALMDFPGKWQLQGRIARAPRVHRSLDWLRQKTDQPLFILPDR
jgi:hypothetical protein